MTELPIIFKGEMVRAILEGRKTQTRRIVKCPSWALAGEWDIRPTGDGVNWLSCANKEGSEVFAPCPYGKPGDRLWVRETWRPHSVKMSCTVQYRADGCHITIENTPGAANRWIDVRRPEEQWPKMESPKWRSSIHMPRWASRISLEVTNVRVERLQEISEEDVKSEGTDWERYAPGPDWPIQNAYAILWDSINAKKHPWDSNPLVWVLEFKKLNGETA